MTLSLLNAPVDDEPLTEEDLADIAAAEEDIRCGRVYTTEQVCEMLGIDFLDGNRVEMAIRDVTTTH
ncbi:MAG TPA: hypothetical protein VKP30_14020 [Polyangiaceae bacterium]|nr:hypothetical protein [Polyangiaceae bacterium]